MVTEVIQSLRITTAACTGHFNQGTGFSKVFNSSFKANSHKLAPKCVQGGDSGSSVSPFLAVLFPLPGAVIFCNCHERALISVLLKTLHMPKGLHLCHAEHPLCVLEQRPKQVPVLSGSPLLLSFPPCSVQSNLSSPAQQTTSHRSGGCRLSCCAGGSGPQLR